MLAAFVASSVAFTAPGLAPATAVRHSPVVALETRRAALASGAGLFAAAAIAPLSAQAKSVEEIAAAANQAAMADREKLESQYDVEVSAGEKAAPIVAIAGVGTLLSGIFIIPNLQRLGTKITSGGEDKGYNRKSGKSIAKQVGMSFFKKDFTPGK